MIRLIVESLLILTFRLLFTCSLVLVFFLVRIVLTPWELGYLSSHTIPYHSIYLALKSMQNCNHPEQNPNLKSSPQPIKSLLKKIIYGL